MGFILAIILCTCFILLFWMVKQAFLNKVVKQELWFTDFPASFGKVSIFFISDIHRRIVSEKIISEVKGQVDMVVIGGDLTEKGVPMDRVKKNIERLRSLGPAYFVWGNNDYEADFHELDVILFENGIKILDNTAAVFESEEGDKLSLLGVDDLSQNRDRIDLALMDAEKNSFKILACHYPKIMEKINPEYGISLVLSGHTHGGQIRLFGFGLYERGKIKKYHKTTLLISNGYGTTTIPLRLGAPAECHLLTIRKAEAPV
jgi:predicted MPP superfamily phosphohydrolase